MTNPSDSISKHCWTEAGAIGFGHLQRLTDLENGDAKPSTEDSLNDVVRGERNYVRERLREELNRDPSDEEIDTWLREQTEGY